jgi:hypothetical protein
MIACDISMWPNWIQAGAAVALVLLTLATLRVLKRYAHDTATIAGVSASQTENSQMPFLTVTWTEPDPPIAAGWEIHNQGFGPALNVRFSIYSNEGVERWRSIADIAKGASRSDFHDQIRLHIHQNDTNNRTFTIKYSSLSGRAYRTTVERLPNKELQTTFHKQ